MQSATYENGVGKLFIVPTPIGNLEDITLRALKTLRSVDYILTERKGTTIKLLRHYKISNKLVTYREDNHRTVARRVVRDIGLGKQVALVSEAGTPLLADPGLRLVNELFSEFVFKKGISPERVITVLPGASAVLTALVGFPLSTFRFMFVGYLPRKANERVTWLEKLIESARAIGSVVVAFESVHRLQETLRQLATLYKNGVRFRVGVAKELTKMYETRRWGDPEGILKWIEDSKRPDIIRGEFVLVLDPGEE